MKYYKILVLLAFFITSSTAIADNVLKLKKKNYIQAAMGYSYPPDKHGTINTARNKGALLGSIGIGYIVNSKFRTDIIASYSGKYKYKATDSIGYERHDVYSIRLMLNGYWHFLRTKHLRFNTLFSPYLMLGLGYANNTIDNISETTQGTTTIFVGRQKSNLAWQIGLGTLLNINNNSSLDFQYKYANLGKVVSRGIQNELGQNILRYTQSPFKEKLRTHEFSIGYFLKFN